MKIRSFFILVFACGTFCSLNAKSPRIAVMETALGNRAAVESIVQAKEAGYAGVQIHTGLLDDDGLMTIMQPGLIDAFKKARAAHGIEIVSLCAGAMNKFNSWDPENREKAKSAALQSIDACVALDVPILLVPFFGKAAFGDDPSDPKFIAATDLLREVSAYAAQKKVMLGIESNTMQPGVNRVLKDVGSPYLKVYYDTGNLLKTGEDVYSVIRDWGRSDQICQMHLKPFESEKAVFGAGKTDFPGLAQAIRDSGYEGWFVFESGPGKKTPGVPYAAENFEGIKRMFDSLPE